MMTIRTVLFALLFVLPPALKPWVLRTFCGARIGKKVSIGWFATVMAREIEIGDHAAVRPLTLVRLDGALRLGRQPAPHRQRAWRMASPQAAYRPAH